MEAAPSSSASAAPADIAFFSVASDRNRIATVVDGLRSRDVQVWWDADSRPRLVDTAPTSLRRAASHRRLVPLRVEPIERSLRRQYVGRPGSRAAGAPDSFSPQDYLEKIFQIPYALAPIDQTASAAGNGESPAPGDGAGQAGQLMVEADEQTDPDAGRKTDEPARGVEAALFFEDHEESFIQLLYAFIDRPRLAKRFVNIYRLLRVRADDENESATFAAEPDSSANRAALTLLAIQVGHARIAAKVGAAIERAPDATKLLGLCEDLAGGRCLSPPCSEDERAEVRAVLDKLKRVGERLLEDLKDYRDWAPRGTMTCPATEQ